MLTAGVGVLGVVQMAAAGVDLLVVAPFARNVRTIKTKAPVTVTVTAPKERYERHLPLAA